MSYGGVTASATFVFDDQGRFTQMTAERYKRRQRQGAVLVHPDYGHERVN